jgi:hypothetical protein
VRNIDVIPGISDHNIVSGLIDIQPLRRIQKPRIITLYNKADWAKTPEELRNFHRQLMNAEPTNDMDVESIWKNFKRKLHQLVEVYIPKKKTKRRRKLPYITREIERLIRRRNRLYKKAKTNKSAFNLSKQSFLERDNKIKAIKKEIQQKMRKAYWSYIESTFTTSEGSDTRPFDGMKKFWQFIKTNKKDYHGVATLKADGKVNTIAKDKANTLNRQFQSVFNSQQAPHPNLLPPSSHPASEEIVITTPGIEKLLRKLKPHKAAGPDDISSRILKELSTEIAPILQIIFQKSYDTSTIPEDWREANVVPIYKKGLTHDPANYRPISLTSICSKVMEHIIASNIMRHARNNNILYKLQHGFLDRRSCETQLLEFQTDILQNLQQNQQTDVLIMDFAKAFDKVSHPHLIQKLAFYGIKGKTIDWITSFLNNRKQRVVLEGEMSDQVPVTSGVPQGSVLGPPLFIYYINDIASNLTSTVRLFADDTVAYLAIKGKDDAVKLQGDLDRLGEWENKWLMKFHPSKCQVLSITKSPNIIMHNYSLHGHILEHVKEAKYLGLTISRDLKWTTHIDNITGQASRTLGFLKRNLQINIPRIKEQRLQNTRPPPRGICSLHLGPRHQERHKQGGDDTKESSEIRFEQIS